MRVLAKTSQMQRRMPKSPTETENPLTLPEPSPTKEKAAKSFEDYEKAEDTKKSTYTMQDQQQQPKKQTKEQNKRPLSNCSCSSVSISTKRKINIDEQELAFLFDPEIDASSCPEITDFNP